LQLLIQEAKNKEIATSLAVFKPKNIVDFTYESVEREWSREKLEKLNQLNLFEQTQHNNFQVVKKLPYKFTFHFQDKANKKSKMMIEDWETGQLYWNSLRRHDGDEVKACLDVRKKYFDDFAKTKDLYFFLGTTQVHHFTARNPFVIIGTFHPKKVSQLDLFN